MLAYTIFTALLAKPALGWNWPDNAVNRTCAISPRLESCQVPSEEIKDTCCSPVDGLVSFRVVDGIEGTDP
jgi:hypothetical protein